MLRGALIVVALGFVPRAALADEGPAGIRSTWGADPDPPAPIVDEAVAESPPPQPRIVLVAPPPPPDITDVVIQGGKIGKPTPATDTFAKAEVRQLPGAFGDPFRAIEVSPGLTPVLSGLPYFYVRGAPPGNVGYYFDGIRVPYLFHFGLGPAVVHPGLIATTDIYKGGYPASLGRWAGGVVDATSLPPADKVHGEGQIRLIDAGGLVETPFANGKGSALVAARYSYTAALFTLLNSDIKLDYRDYQGRVSYELGEHDRLTVIALGAYDHASQKDSIDASTFAAAHPTAPPPQKAVAIERVLFASEFHRANLRWDHALGESGRFRADATVGFDQTRIEGRRSASDVMYGLRALLEQPIGKHLVVRTGADLTVDDYQSDPLPRYSDDDDVIERQQHIFLTRRDYAVGAYLETVLRHRDFEFVPGIRGDMFGSGDRHAVGFDPRFSARERITDHVRLIQSVGLATQPPSMPVTLPAVTIANLEGGLQRSVQTSAGIEAELPKDFSGTVSVFHQSFMNLNDAFGNAQFELEDLEKSNSLLEKSKGQAYGLEIGVKRKVTQRLSGLFAYTLSRSERTADGITFVSSYDRTHVLNFALSYDLGRMWRVGARYVAYTGTPVQKPAPAYPQQATGTPPERTPLFMRLDVRVEKRWKVGKNGWVSVVLEALNATLSSEVSGYRCGTALVLPGASPNPTCAAREVGPISVPSLGVEAGF